MRQVLGQGPLVLAAPDIEGKNVENGASWVEKCVVMRRGGITFVDKVLKAQEHRVAGVLVIQSTDAWPYTMGDATNNPAAQHAVRSINSFWSKFGRMQIHY